MNKEPITIYFTADNVGNNCFEVCQGDKSSYLLGYDEVLGLIAALIMPENRPCLQWMVPNNARHYSIPVDDESGNS